MGIYNQWGVHSMAGEAPDQPMIKILYAEACIAHSAAIKELLEQSESVRQILGPCHVTTVSSGQSALEHANQHAFDIILVDCHLPDISGLEIARDLLRNHP